MLIGVGGLGLLFRPRLELAGNADELYGLAAIVAGTLAYCLGSLLARPVLEGARPLAVAGLPPSSAVSDSWPWRHCWNRWPN